jgi:hypothetical protein
MIAWVPLASTTGRALVGVPLILAVGLGCGLYVYLRHRSIVQRGAQVPARVVEVELTRPDQELAARLRNVRLVLAFDGADGEPVEYRAFRLRAADAETFVADAVVQVWGLPDDLSEVRIGRPDGVGQPLPFYASNASD